jgi:hypothetical protein
LELLIRNCETETTKQDMQWTIFKLIMSQHPIPLVDNTMSMIVEALQQEATVGELGKKDVWSGHRP